MGLLLGLRRLSSLSAFESFFLRDNLNVFVVTVKVVIGGARTCVGNARTWLAESDSRLCGFCQSLLSVRSISRQSTRILPGHLQFPAESPPFQHLQVCLQLANVFRLGLSRSRFFRSESESFDFEICDLPISRYDTDLSPDPILPIKQRKKGEQRRYNVFRFQ